MELLHHPADIIDSLAAAELLCLITCLFVCLLACLLACLFACLLVCLLACLFVLLPCLLVAVMTNKTRQKKKYPTNKKNPNPKPKLVADE